MKPCFVSGSREFKPCNVVSKVKGVAEGIRDYCLENVRYAKEINDFLKNNPTIKVANLDIATNTTHLLSGIFSADIGRIALGAGNLYAAFRSRKNNAQEHSISDGSAKGFFTAIKKVFISEYHHIKKQEDKISVKPEESNKAYKLALMFPNYIIADASRLYFAIKGDNAQAAELLTTSIKQFSEYYKEFGSKTNKVMNSWVGKTALGLRTNRIMMLGAGLSQIWGGYEMMKRGNPEAGIFLMTSGSIRIMNTTYKLFYSDPHRDRIKETNDNTLQK